MAEVSQVILKLGVDAKGVFADMDKIKAKYGESTAYIRKQNEELAKLTAKEKELLAARTKANSPNQIVALNNELKKTQDNIAKTNKLILEQSQNVALVNKQSKDLKGTMDKAFDGTVVNGVEKATVSLRSQLKNLKAQIAATDDDQEFIRLSVEAGKIEDKIQDATTAVRIFATESKFESVGSALGNIGQKLLSLDFKGAADGSELLLKASQAITFKDAIAGIGQLGTTLLNVGKALLTNPLFLIGAAVTLIVTNFDNLKNASGALGASFRFIGDIIQGVIQGFTDLTDAIGLTNVASDKFAKEAIDNLSSLSDATDKFYDRSIKLAKAQGKDTEKLQEQQLENRIKNLKAELDVYQNHLYASGRAGKDFSEEENKKMQEYGDKIIDAVNELQTLKAQVETDARKEKEKKDKEAAEKALKLAQEQAKQLRDLEAANIGNEYDRKRAQATIDANDKIEAAKGNAKLIAEINRSLQIQIESINKDEVKANKEKNDKILADAKQANDELLNEMLAAEEKRKAALQTELTENQRHQTAMLSISLRGQKDAQVIMQANEIANAKEQLDFLKSTYPEKEAEIIAQQHKIEELEAEHISTLNDLDKQRTKQVLDNTQKIISAAIDSANQILDAETQKVDGQIALQQKRVDEVSKIAENGNAELLELEQKRLDELNKKKEKYVRAQQALATIELVANTAITVSKAAAEGGAGAAATIAVALLALIGGLASARAIAGQAAFYEGGYTGDGNPREESSALGSKPYIYHKGEFVHDHKSTRKYRGIFEDVHKGKLDLNEMKSKAELYDMLRMNRIDTSRDTTLKSLEVGNALEINKLKASMDSMVYAVKSMPGMQVSINEKGIFIIANKYYKDKQRIDAISR